MSGAFLRDDLGQADQAVLGRYVRSFEGRDKTAATPQIGRQQRELVLLAKLEELNLVSKTRQSSLDPIAPSSSQPQSPNR